MAVSAGLEKVSGYFLLQWGWRRLFIAILAGAISALSMAPFHLFFVLFFTFPVLVWLIDGTIAEPSQTWFARAFSSFKIGWCFAFGYFLASFWWTGSALLVEAEEFAWALPFAIIGLPAVLALFWGVAIALARLGWSEDWRRLMALALAIGLAEYARGHLFTGLPWNSIGYAAMPNTLTMQSASVVGLYAMGVFAVLVFSAPALFSPATAGKPRGLRGYLTFVLVILLVHVGFGYLRLDDHPTRFVEGVHLRIVQPNISQEDKWKSENEAAILNSYLKLSATKADVEPKDEISNPTHYIWPESAFPFLLTQRRDALTAIGEALPEGTLLITGAARAEAGLTKTTAKYFNSVYVINHEGEIAAAGDKVHLVPFGEYLPMQDIAHAIGLKELVYQKGGFSAGSQRRTLNAGSAGRFLPLICYEIIFSGAIGNPSKKSERASWIVNVTNDGWFGMTPGPYQHHHQAVVRGVEEGLPVVRAANSGISSISDAYGRIVSSSLLGRAQVLDGKLPTPAARTLFSLFGPIFFWGMSIFFLLLIAARPRH